MADDGQTAEVLDDKTDMGEAPIGYTEDRKDAEILPEIGQAIPSETLNLASEEDEQHILGADALRTHTQIELDHVEYIGDYFDALIHSPSNIRKKQLDADTDKLNSEIEGLQQKADKIIEDKKLREKADEILRISGEGALEVLLNSTTKNIDKDKEESAKAEVYTELLNISLDIKRTLKKDYATDDQPFQLADDDSFPVKNILPALALHLYEDGNIQSVEDLAVISSQEGIEAITATIVASHKAAIVEEQNKKNKRLKKLRSDIAKKNDEIARKNEEKQEIAPEAIQEERAEFLRTRPDLRNSLNSLGQYKKSLDIALEAPSAEAYFAGNEDMLAIFNHMDSELGDDADAIALKRNDDRKRYFITLKNLDEEHFDELVREAQQDIASLADLIDQDRKAVSQNYIPAVETLDKLAKSVKPNTAAPEQAAESADADEADGEADAQEEMAPVNYTSFAQYKQRADKAITALTNSLKSKERSEYEAYLAAVEERGTEDATEEQLEAIKTHGENLLQSATEADAKLAQKRPDNTPMLRRANIMGAALAFADEADAHNYFKNPENSNIIDVLNKKIEGTDSEEQKGEYESLKKMMVAASSVDAYQAEKGSPISIMQNLRDDVDALRAKAEENGEDADATDEKIIDALRSHMDTMAETYLPTEKQLKKAQKTTLGNRIKSLVQRVTGTRDKVKKERIEPTISDEQMNAAIDKLVEPESDHEIDPENGDLSEEREDDHDDLLFADEEDDRLEPEDAQDPGAPDAEEKLDSESDPFDLFEEQDEEAERDNDEPEQPDLTLEDEEKAASGDELDSDEPVDAKYDEVEETEDPDQDDEPEIAKDGRQADTTNPTMTTGVLAATFGIAAVGGAALLGIDINAENIAIAAASGATLGMFVDSFRKVDTKKMIGQIAVAGAVSWGVKSLGFAGLSMLGTAGILPVVAGIGICALAGGLASMASTALFDKSENRNLGSAFIRGAITGGIIGAFAPMLGEFFSGDGADNALAGGQNTDLTANGAENAGLSGGEPEQTLAPDPEASIEPGAGVNNDLTGNADLTEVSGPDFGDMSAAEIREAAGVMYTEGDYQGALDALNVALEKAPEWLDESIQGDIANIAMVHGLEPGTEGFDSASDMLRSSFAEAGQEGHGRNEDYLRMLMEKRDLLSPSGPSMS